MYERSPLIDVWNAINQRCYNPRHPSYHHYGGRGIQSYWHFSFQKFEAWAWANGYQPGLSIERIDNDGPYSPENCTWIPRSRQVRNTRRSRQITAWGETKRLMDWLDDPRCTIYSWKALTGRLDRGWPPEIAMTAPPQSSYTRSKMLTAWGETKRLSDWVLDPRCMVSYTTLWMRVDQKWPHEVAISATLDTSQSFTHKPPESDNRD